MRCIMNLNYESGKVGDYKGTPVYVVDEFKFDMRKANRNFIYALGHQGTSEKLNLIFWDGNHWRQLGAVNATGNDVQENKPDSRPIYRFGRTEEEEEDWLTEMKKATKARNNNKEEEKRPVMNSSEFITKVEEIEDLTTLSAGIDNYIQEQLNRDWLSQDL